MMQDVRSAKYSIANLKVAIIRRPRLRKGEREREKDFLTQQG
jgi:hypothetical protein